MKTEAGTQQDDPILAPLPAARGLEAHTAETDSGCDAIVIANNTVMLQDVLQKRFGFHIRYAMGYGPMRRRNSPDVATVRDSMKAAPPTLIWAQIDQHGFEQGTKRTTAYMNHHLSDLMQLQAASAGVNSSRCVLGVEGPFGAIDWPATC